MPNLLGAYPISDEDVMALPVKSIATAARYYETLGFSVEEETATHAVLVRDSARIGLVLQPAHDPGKAGSIAFPVDDIEAMHRELSAAGAKPGEFGIDEWNGKKHQTFFVREDEDGYCYCFFNTL